MGVGRVLLPDPNKPTSLFGQQLPHVAVPFTPSPPTHPQPHIRTLPLPCLFLMAVTLPFLSAST